MNAPTRFAQVTVGAGSKPTKILKVDKPQGGQAVTLEASYDGTVKVDFSAIANEKITLVHIGERLIILFDNQSTVTIIPFFDSMGVPLANITIESNGKEFTAAEFASTFPITTDQSVLPAAGDAAGTPASGANFSNASVDPLLGPDPLPLLGPEELPGINFTRIEGPVPFNALPTTGDNLPVSIDEDDINDPPGFSQGIGNTDSPGDDEPIRVTGVLNFFAGTPPATVDLESMADGLAEVRDTDGNLLTSQGHDLVYVWDVDTLKAEWADLPGHVVFQIQVDPATGAYTLTLFDQLDHPVVGVEDNLLVELIYTVTDGNGDVATGSLTVDFDDDMPHLTGQAQARIVDEDDIKTAWSHGTSPNDGDADGSDTDFTGAAFVSGTLAGLVDIGADEVLAVQREPEGEENHPSIIASGIVFSFTSDVIAQMEALGLHSKQSVQPATENGIPLTYTTGTSGDWLILSAFEPDEVPGAPDTGNPVFELRVNQISGEYEFRLFDELIHDLPPGFPNGSDENFTLRTTGVDALDFGSIIQVTDYDGDSVTLAGAFTIQIRDDVPEADIHVNPLGISQHDETPGTQGPSFSDLADSDTNSAAVKALFASLETSGTVGDDPDVPGDTNGAVPGDGPIGYARSVLPVVLSVLGTDVGADFPAASTTFSLQIVGGPDSGLLLTDGSHIHLFREGNLIVGRVIDQVGTDNYVGQAAFAIHIDGGGFVSMAQYLSLKHPIFPDNHDESLSLDGKIEAVLTVTDSDGDSDSDSAQIGSQIRFDDDGPKVEVKDQVSDEARAQLKLALDESLGPDRYNTGESNDGGPNDDVTGATLPLVPLTTPDSASDAIGTRTTNVNGGLNALFNVTVNFGADGPLPVQEGDNPTDVLSFNLTGSGETNLVVTALDGTVLEGLTDAQRTVFLVEVDANTIEGRIRGLNGVLGGGDDYVAFRIAITPGSQIQIDQFLAIDHDASEPSGAPENPENPSLFDESIDLRMVGSSNTLQLVRSITATDGDNDTDSDSDFVTLASSGTGTLFFSFDDDGPTVTATLNQSATAAFHDETAFVQVGVGGTNANDQDDVTGASLPAPILTLFNAIGAERGEDPHVDDATEEDNQAIGFARSGDGTSILSFTPDYGTDGPNKTDASQASYDLTVIDGTVSGLQTTEGVNILLYNGTGTLDGLILGRVGGAQGAVAFALTIDTATGELFVAQYLSLEHPDAGNGTGGTFDELITLAEGTLFATVTIIDGDSDKATSNAVDIGELIGFQDDGPTTGPTTVEGKVCLTSGGAQGADPSDLLFVLPAGAGLTIDVSDIINAADHQNSLGYYFADASGNPISGAILSDHAGNPNNEDVLVTIPAGSVPAGAALLGFFLIPDGNDLNPSLADGDSISFNLVSGFWVASNTGGPLASAQGSVLFSDRRFNPDDNDAGSNPNDFETGTGVRDSNWEDVISGDNDFNDVQFNVEVCATSNVLILDDEDQFPHTLIGSPGIQGGPGDDGAGTFAAGSVNIDYGSDGPATTTNPLEIAAGVVVTNSLNADGGPLHVVWVDAEGNGVPELVSYQWQANPAGGGTLYGISGHFPTTADPVFSLVIDVNGNFTFDLNGPLAHPFTDNDFQNNGVDTEFEDNLTLAFNFTATDGDGDTATGTITIKVDDDTPDPVCDTATVKEGSAAQNINAVFVLDFSGSIDNTELNTMLNAVKAAGQELFNNTSGDVQLHIVAFSGTATDFGPFNTFAAFEAQVNAINGVGRPFAGQTDFTAGIEETMDEWTPLNGYSNQVFFISDGNPNEQTGTGGNSLADPTAVAWQQFINDNDLTVTTVGIGDGIINARLQDVDLDGAGSPIAITDFDDLIDALIQVIAGPSSGNVLDNDGFGADGLGPITSITVTETDGTHTYSYDPAGNDILKDGLAWVPGNNTSILQVTTGLGTGGGFTFYFTDTGTHDAGDWNYQPPSDGVPAPSALETFTYTIVDRDGDGQSAQLKITVLDNPIPTAGTSNAFLDDEGRPGGIPGTPAVGDDIVANVDSDNNEATYSGTLPFNFFADTPGELRLVDGSQTVGGNTYTYDANAAGTSLTASIGATVYFTVTLNPTTGAYTVALNKAIPHPTTGTEDNLDFNLAYQVEDSSGDVATGSLVINIDDDVPVADINLSATPFITVDESIGQNGGEGTEVGNLGSVTVLGSALFVSSSQFGADGAASVNPTVYSLTVAPGGVDSGLDETGSGHSIFLFNESGIIRGREGLNAGDAVSGDIAFEISVNSGNGNVTVTQFRAIKHDDINDHDESDDNATQTNDHLAADESPNPIQQFIASGALSLTQTITDGDGDKSSDFIELGSLIRFEDDGPNVDFAGETTVNENGLPDASANGTYSFFAGSDGTFSGSLTISVNGSPIATIQAAEITDNGHTVVTSVGTLVLSTPTAGNGTWTFTPVAVTATATVGISITLTDRDGDFDSDTHTFTVVNVNSPLTISGSVTGLVEEEHGLAGGIEDVNDQNGFDTDEGGVNTVTNVAAGSFGSQIVGGVEGTLSFQIATFATPLAVNTVANGPLMSGDKQVYFHRVDADTLIGFTNSDGGSGTFGDAGDTTVFTLQLTNTTTGAYTFTLQAPLEHPGNSVEDAIAINLNGRVTATDSGGPGTDTAALNASITVIDDIPVTGAVTKNLSEGQVHTNLMLILDISGSMSESSGLTGLSRMDVLKASVVELLEQYDNIGNVMVRIVTFSTDANAIGPVWQTVDAAKTAVLALTPTNLTNYDEALTDAMSAFASTGKIAGAQNVSYFVSDGQPNEPSGSPGINGTEETTWENFLSANDIVSFALGAGSAVTQSALDPIAYNGATDTEANAIVVTDLGQLTATLVGTVNAVTATGNLLAEGAPVGGFGADGGFVKSIQVVDDGINDKTYTYNPVTDTVTITGAGTSTHVFNAATNVVTITTATGATLAVDYDNGAYTYNGPGTITTNFTESFNYVLQDGDGDTVGNALTINVANGDRSPIVRDDRVITNVSGSGASTVIPEYALLYNDTDPDGQSILVTGSASLISDATSVPRASGNFTFSDNDSDGGSFTYTGTTSAPVATDTGVVSVNRAQAGESTLDGTGLGDILIGRDGSADTIIGNAGNDVLIGYGGNDSLDGGTGVEILDGGAGNDTLVADASDIVINGGADTDTLQIGASFNDASNAQIVGIENVTLTAAGLTLNLGDQTEGFKIVGSTGSDTIVGGGGADIILGRTGSDNLTGGGGIDQFRLQTDGGLDTVTDFVVGTDKIGFLEGGGGLPAVNFGVTGTAAGALLTAGDGNFTTRGSIATINSGDDSQLVLINAAGGQTTAQITADINISATNLYVMVFNSTTNKAEIWFDTDWDNTSGRVQVATLNGVTAAQVAALTASDFVVYNSATDPLILDLGAPGLEFTGVLDGVSFDINADGALDHVAWTVGEDGILALDIDGNGTIDSGAEIFSPDFAGGGHAGSLAALATLDGNGDGVIDADDAVYGNLQVWQDLNHNGVSEAGELTGLAALGITGINLGATPADGTVNSQQLLAEGTFNYADGSTGNFAEVAFDTELGAPQHSEPFQGYAGSGETYLIDANAPLTTIEGFTKGDRLDLSALLDANYAAGDNVDDFIRLQENGTDITVQVDANGPSGGANFVDVVVLPGFGTSNADIVRAVFENQTHQVQA